MPFNSLPDELIAKILIFLFDDTKSFINFSSLNRRFLFISRTVTRSPSWIKTRPISFNLYLNLDLYKQDLRKEHVSCLLVDEKGLWIGCKCESTTNNNIDIVELSTPTVCQEDPPCYYQRLFCCLNAVHRNFSSIKFKNAHLSNRSSYMSNNCLRSFQDSLELNRTLAEHNIRALVELELFECDITLDWLNTALNHLTGVRYLTLNGITFTEHTIQVDPKFLASKTLNRLKITDRSFRMTDSIFLYFLENFPAIEFDLSSTNIEFHKRIIQRFYNNADIVGSYTAQPSDDILTFPMILLYLKKYQSIVKHFIASGTNITYQSLERILQDDELKHLKITVRDCPMITQLERNKLFEQVDTGDIKRIIF